MDIVCLHVLICYKRLRHLEKDGFFFFFASFVPNYSHASPFFLLGLPVFVARVINHNIDTFISDLLYMIIILTVVVYT